MRALIIAGGLGTRLRPLTEKLPKSLMPIANKPHLEHQVRMLLGHGIRDITLLTGYRADAFDPFRDQMRAFGANVDVSQEQAPLDTAGAVRTQLERLDGTTLVLNGDVLTEVDVTDLIRFHAERGAVATLYLNPVDDVSAYGVVPLDDDGRVREFREKPPAEEFPDGGLINAGLYVLEPSAFDGVPAETPWSFERRLFPDLLASGRPVFGYPSDAYWIDIGNPPRYLQAHRDIMDGRARVAIDGQLIERAMSFEDGTAILAPSLLSHAPVGPGSTIGPYVCLAPGVRIGAHSRIEGSVIHEGVRIGPECVIRDSIIGSGVEIDEGSQIVGGVLA